MRARAHTHTHTHTYTHTHALTSFSRPSRASSCRDLEDGYQITVFGEVERGEVVQVNIVVVVQSLSHVWLCDPINCSTPMPDFSVLHYLPEFAQTHVHWVGDAILPSHPLPPSSTPQRLSSVFLSVGSFSVSRPFALSGQIIGTSASASILPMNIQGWFPLGSTGLIFLPSKEFSRVFSSTTIWRHLFCGAHLAASYFKFRVQLRFFFFRKLFPYPFKSGLASLVSQTVRSLPAVWETRVRSLG